MISQDNKPIVFYSRKLNTTQVNYTTTKRELSSIVSTLKEVTNILLGQQMKLYADNKNLTYKSYDAERIMRKQLILEEPSLKLICTKGFTNFVADVLTCRD